VAEGEKEELETGDLALKTIDVISIKVEIPVH